MTERELDRKAEDIHREYKSSGMSSVEYCITNNIQTRDFWNYMCRNLRNKNEKKNIRN